MKGMVFNKFLQSFRCIQKSGSYGYPKKIAIALSGGVDSVVLLDMLVKYKELYKKDLEIHAITIDHGLRMQSGEEARRLNRVIMDEMKYPIVHRILKIEAKINSNQMEKHARELRYRLMYNYCSAQNIETIFMGHHLDDQLETFVLRLLSNSTIFGLLGMRPVMPGNLTHRNKIDLVRPLLQIPKSEIYQYAKTGHLEWFEDHTNQDVALTSRNRIRHFLGKNADIRNDLTALHGSLTRILNDSVYSKFRDIATDSQLAAESVFNDRLLTMELKLAISPHKWNNLTSVDFLVLDRWIFNKVWLVSPSKNYLYGFTKFDNKYSVIEPSKNKRIRSLSEDLIDRATFGEQQITLAGCLFRWTKVAREDGSVVVKVNIVREPPHRKESNCNIEVENTAHSFLYDNRVFMNFKAKAANASKFMIVPASRKLLLQSYLSEECLSDVIALVCISSMTLIEKLIQAFDHAHIPILLTYSGHKSKITGFPTIIPFSENTEIHTFPKRPINL